MAPATMTTSQGSYLNGDSNQDVVAAANDYVGGSDMNSHPEHHVKREIRVIGDAVPVTNGINSDHDIEPSSYEPIAIIGCAMRLPGGVNNADALWGLLDGRHEGRCRVPYDRYNIDAFYGPGKAGHVCTEYG